MSVIREHSFYSWIFMDAVPILYFREHKHNQWGNRVVLLLSLVLFFPEKETRRDLLLFFLQITHLVCFFFVLLHLKELLGTIKSI
jgi:hypothetical protein